MFPVTNPFLFRPSYSFQASDSDLAALDLTDVKKAQILCVVTVPHNKPREISINLQGPILVNGDNRKGQTNHSHGSGLSAPVQGELRSCSF